VHEPCRAGPLVAAEVADAGVGERGAELLPAHVAEVVEAEDVGAVAARVVAVDEVHVFLEDAEAAALLAVVTVHLVVHLPPLVQVPQRLVRRQVALVERDGAAQLQGRHHHHHQKKKLPASHPASVGCYLANGELDRLGVGAGDWGREEGEAVFIVTEQQHDMCGKERFELN
jgi:hypothetical protein